MNYTILDCYTDEPSGLGVPPYIGTYPRYLAGAILAEKSTFNYITIDDLRLFREFDSIVPKTKPSEKTNIRVYNHTKKNVKEILENTDKLVVIAGIQTPGKYLSAVPATLREIAALISDINCEKILTGPAVLGTQKEGGKFFEKTDEDIFDEIEFNFLGINDYEKIADYAVKGAEIVKQIPYEVIAEIETGKGCSRKPGCSFCTEPLKNNLQFREQNDVHKEIEALKKEGVEHFRLGKQSCFYSYKGGKPEEIEKLLKPIGKVKTLHIDNVNPAMVVGKNGRKITELVVKYCTAGNVAAFGIESFDEKVIKANNLNTSPEQTFEAVKIINEIGGKRGANGMHSFLPGINLIFGLKDESKETLEKNYEWLKKMLDENLLLRRINIRQLAVFPGTAIYEDVGNKFLKKNRKHYWKYRNLIRTEVDFPMLQRIAPKDTVIKDVRAEIYDGKTTFCRQFGSYPLIVGVKGRLELSKFYNIKVTGHMLRSIIGEVL
ncbi:MAG: radical SAM protein [bacterium]|nr:radical SAM protein [bacterium]